MTLVAGEKEFTLAHPSSFLNLYPHTFATCNGNDQKGEIYRFSQLDVKNPDLAKYPKFAKVTLRTATIRRYVLCASHFDPCRCNV